MREFVGEQPDCSNNHWSKPRHAEEHFWTPMSWSRRLPRSQSYFCHLRAGNWNYISRRLAKIGQYKKCCLVWWVPSFTTTRKHHSIPASIRLLWCWCTIRGYYLNNTVLPVSCCWLCRFLYDQNFWNLWCVTVLERYKATFTVHLDWDMASIDPDPNKMEQLGDVVKREIHVPDVQWINLQKLRLAPSFVPQKHVIVRKMLFKKKNATEIKNLLQKLKDNFNYSQTKWFIKCKKYT